MKYSLRKFRYLYDGIPEVPEPWEYQIYIMLSKIDIQIRKGSGISRFILNKFYDLSKGKLFSNFSSFYLKSFLKGFKIDGIKQKFATLRIVGEFSKFEEIINETINVCNNKCEFCGQLNTDKVMIKSWVRNLCQDCQAKHKNNGSNI